MNNESLNPQTSSETTNSSPLLEFIKNTKDGNYNENKIFLETIEVSRINFDEQIFEVQDVNESFENTNILFGISN